MKNPIFLLRTAIGRMKGYGGCAHCGGTWNFKKPFDIEDGERSGAFPICTDCARKLTPQQIMTYLEELYVSWFRESSHPLLLVWIINKKLAYVRKNRSIEKALEKL